MPANHDPNDQGPTLRMQDLLRQVPITRRAVRFYEAQGLVCPAGKDRLGRRLYLRSDLPRLRLIRDLRVAGLPVPAIRDLLDSRVPRAAETGAAWLARLRLSLSEQAQALHSHLEAVRRAHLALQQANAWLDEHHDALRDSPGCGQNLAAAAAPPLLRVLLEQPLFSLPTARAAYADDLTP